MTALSFERLLKSSRLAMAAPRSDAFVADRSIRLTRPDRERFEGKIRTSGGASGGSSAGIGLTKKLSARLKTKPPRKSGGKVQSFAPSFDPRQRAVVKIHYFNHAGAGGSALKAHGKYVARDAAGRDGPHIEHEVEQASKEQRSQARAHAHYLDRNERGVFYDAESDRVDGAARLENWASADRRHFRLILSAEEGGRLRDLQAYTREVMARAGAALGTKLSWVAVDHRDTDNPHTHIVLRGRRANGQDLVLPKDFIKHGFRNLARDVATEWLGTRTREQERQALDRDVRGHAPTRLDAMIATQAPDRVLRMAKVQAPNGDPALTQAMKARAQELARMGLAEEVQRGIFRLTPDWRERLQALELHLDIRKRIVQERIERNVAQHAIERQMRKGLLDR